ncbi:hypothetical protein [Pseudaminobacter sp. NGMCC 1.201702]|uniref:hypothetical protein n=1 Tax=Pseudaminobacter sp. NGMCC 1.201702 TaxID=3391825 RepID=UPI0039EE6364
MRSDFAQARYHLEQAWLRLVGHDETSLNGRQALDLLIEAVATAEFTVPKGKAEVIAFPKKSSVRL